LTDCIFCKIVAGDIPSERVYEDGEVLAFRDVQPVAPTHVLVIPKKHIADITELGDAGLASKLIVAINEVVKDQGLVADGFRVVNNCGEQGGQTVGHLHFHVLGGRDMQWPPG